MSNNADIKREINDKVYKFHAYKGFIPKYLIISNTKYKELKEEARLYLYNTEGEPADDVLRFNNLIVSVLPSSDDTDYMEVA